MILHKIAPKELINEFDPLLEESNIFFSTQNSQIKYSKINMDNNNNNNNNKKLFESIIYEKKEESKNIGKIKKEDEKINKFGDVLKSSIFIGNKEINLSSSLNINNNNNNNFNTSETKSIHSRLTSQNQKTQIEGVAYLNLMKENNELEKELEIIEKNNFDTIKEIQILKNFLEGYDSDQNKYQFQKKKTDLKIEKNLPNKNLIQEELENNQLFYSKIIGNSVNE